jgi:NAD(P)-dependent dehydrogenase (short-subunit alcohol dehydrogenase family)
VLGEDLAKDLKQEACEREAAPIGAFPVAADVGREEDIANLVTRTIERFGRIDLFVSNAGIAIDGGINTPTDKWQKIINVNLMSEVFAAKYAIPHMLEQGSGYLLNVASAAGLLVIPDTVSYTVTKHAAVGFTEWLATMYGGQGIGVSLLCPAAVLTPILAGKEDTPEGQDAITTDQLADIVIEGLAEERFMINTHPWVLEKFAIKARDYDEYIAMLQADRAAEEAKTAAGV